MTAWPSYRPSKNYPGFPWTVEYQVELLSGKKVVNRYGVFATKADAQAYIEKVWSAQ